MMDSKQLFVIRKLGLLKEKYNKTYFGMIL